MTEAALGSVVFVAIVLMLVAVVLAARLVLMPRGQVTIRVNDRTQITAPMGAKLLAALAEAGVSIPAACGGVGTCGQCRIEVVAGGTAALPIEAALLSRRDIARGTRLACQTTLRGDLSARVPEGLLLAQTHSCRVLSSRTVAPLIREIVLALPEGAGFEFTPGAFVMIAAPPHALRYSDYLIAAEYRAAWDRMGLNALTSKSREPVSRAYSIASNASEAAGRITLLIRLVLPPPGRPDLPPGIVSSWLFGLSEDDPVSVSGPFGTFAAQETDREMVFIGGGAGMAPLRAIITDQLERRGSGRKISFWYGARSRLDLFYEPEFDRLQAEHPGFHWTAALSEPAPEDDWHGETGFIHEVVLRRYLAAHPAPHECEYYLCGPPLMIRAVLAMLEDLGVEPERIFNDDFGG